MADGILTAKGLKKSFGKKVVLNGLDVSLNKGDIYILFGSNGAGKTTLVKMLATLMPVEKGEVRHFGLAMEDDNIREIRGRIGFMSHEPYLYRDLTAYENLAFFADLYSIREKEKRVEEMLKMVRLYHRSLDRVGSFSRGMKQRLALARTFLHSPELVFLDEPYSGLDMSAQTMLNELIRHMNATGTTFFIITHDLERGLEIATRSSVLSGGKIVLEDTEKKCEEFAARYKEILRGEGD